MVQLALIILALAAPFYSNAERVSDVSILSECLWNKELYYQSVDCNDLYHHYSPKKSASPPKGTSGQVRIGGFNIYRLGLRDTRFKDLELVSKIINRRWDVVALSEIHHNMALSLRSNAEALREYLDGMSPKIVKKSYRVPGYLSLLLQLQKLDPSWGLILSPVGQGRTHELTGFIYRKSIVRPAATKYCGSRLSDMSQGPIKIYAELHEAYKKGFERYSRAKKRKFIKPKGRPVACHLGLRGMERDHFSRIPLVGRFKSGKFDFSLISHHARFRQPALAKGKCLEECKALQAKMEKFIGLASGIEKLPGSEVARFFEANAIIKSAARIAKEERDKDVIAVGDFNLEYGPEAARGRNAVWDYLLKKLPQSDIFIEGRTSLSKKAGPSQSYDHFIFPTGKDGVTECNQESIRAVDFTAPKFSQARYFKALFDERSHEKLVAKHLKTFNEKYRIINGVPHPLFLSSESEIRDYLDSFPESDAKKMERDYFRATRRRFKDCTTGETIKGRLFEARRNDFFCRILWQVKGASMALLKDPQNFRPYTELVSDHMPIEMSCRTN